MPSKQLNSLSDYRTVNGTKNTSGSHMVCVYYEWSVLQFYLNVTVKKEFALKIFAMAVLLLMAAWGFNYFGDTGLNMSAQHNKQKNDALIKAGDECVSISERASAHLVPKLEFQRLELEARKANVVVRCMADHDFHQNPVWLKYAEPIATKMSLEQNISVNEVLEKLKRTDMLIFEPVTSKPVYWQFIKK